MPANSVSASPLLKVLIDEDLPHKLRVSLPQFETITVAYLNWDGLKNGELLKAAEDHGFDVLVTSDKGYPHQQNLSGKKLAVVVLSAQDWNVLKMHVAKIARSIALAKPGTFSRVDCGRLGRNVQTGL